jgi:hypothetical protein
MLCSGESDMFRVTKHCMPVDPAERVVYVVGNAPSGADCTGEQWELTPTMTGDREGWMCLATRAVDKVGNVGVSPPLRICVDLPGIDGTPTCDPDSMPSCRADCEEPPSPNPGLIDID